MFDTILYPAHKNSDSSNYEIRTILKDGITLFSLSDVVKVISKETQDIDNSKHSNQTSLIKESLEALDDDEKIEIKKATNINDQPDFEYFLTEPGVYRIVSRSNSTGAKRFQRWVYHEVMPSIRKYGSYPPPHKPDGSFLLQLADQQAKQSQLLSQFIRDSENKLNELNEKVESHNQNISILKDRIVQIETKNLNSIELYDIRDVLKKEDISLENLEYIIALCEKICIERNEPKLDGENREGQKFTKKTIETAISYSRLK